MVIIKASNGDVNPGYSAMTDIPACSRSFKISNDKSGRITRRFCPHVEKLAQWLWINGRGEPPSTGNLSFTVCFYGIKKCFNIFFFAVAQSAGGFEDESAARRADINQAFRLVNDLFPRAPVK